MKIRAIGFDYGGVMTAPSGAEFENKAAYFLGVELQKFREVYFKYNYLINDNVASHHEFWKTVIDELGRQDRFEMFLKYLDSLPPQQVNPEMVTLVEKLKKHGYKVGILSNNSVVNSKAVKESSASKHFDVVVTSADIGCSKPEPKAFQIFIEKLGIKPEELVYVDDTEQSLSTARQVGYHPVLYSDVASLVEKLKKLKVTV